MNANFVTRNTCPVCGGEETEIIRACSFLDNKVWLFLDKYYSGRIPKEKMEFDYCIVKCNKCDFLFQKYILDDENMFLLYEKWISPEDSLNKKKLSDISLFANYAFEIQRICKILNKKPHEINVLEFGMGWGFWSNLAKAFNFNVTGVELSKTRIDYAKNSGLRIIDDISQEKEESYDYIYSNQVFEHIPNPREVLNTLARLLKRPGVIYIGVPDGRAIERKLKQPNWEARKDALHPLEHINCYNRKSLKILTKQAGLASLPTPYYPRTSGMVTCLKSHLKYIQDRFFSTSAHFIKT